MNKKLSILVFLCTVCACSVDKAPDLDNTCEKYTDLRDQLSSYVSESMDDILTYSLIDGRIDNELAEQTANLGRPAGIPEYYPVFQTKSSNVESLSEKQYSVLESLYALADTGSFDYYSAQTIVGNSSLEGEDLEAMYLFVAIADGVYEGMLNAENPLLTKAMSPETRQYICDILAGTCVSIWASWGGAIAAGLGICSGGIATLAATVVSIAVSPLMARAMKCNEM